MSYTDQLSQLTKQYNESIRALKDSYTLERSQSKGWNLTSSHLKKQYSKRYEALEKEYHNKRNELTSLYKNEHPEWAKGRRKWGWTFVIGIVLAMTCCTASLPAEESPINEAITSSSGRTEALSETTYWNADNIPIPYLKDSTQYVSNPDNVLTPQTVERMNVTLQRLNLELGIQSVTIVVNHIENDDPFRMAQDVGNKYGVGHGDKGLIVVVGYEDHSINISPGRSLEGDLTDVECRRLQQEYAVPFMKREQPDSAMIYLTEALYSTLEKKALPTVNLSQGSNDSEDDMALVIGLTFAFLTVWCLFFARKNREYHWISLGAATILLSNPFYEAPRSSRGGGFGGFGGGRSSGGGFSGGSFGGGSFGGGGATSRW
jgi:uncharacterized membrane protein YgcG